MSSGGSMGGANRNSVVTGGTSTKYSNRDYGTMSTTRSGGSSPARSFSVQRNVTVHYSGTRLVNGHTVYIFPNGNWGWSPYEYDGYGTGYNSTAYGAAQVMAAAANLEAAQLNNQAAQANANAAMNGGYNGGGGQPYNAGYPHSGGISPGLIILIALVLVVLVWLGISAANRPKSKF